MDWPFALSFFVALFSVLNPVHAIPLYLGMVPEPTPQDSHRIPMAAALTIFIALSLVLLGGPQLLLFFGITVPAFQAGGGVIILLMGVSMLQGQVSAIKQVPEEAAEASQRESIAVVPLGMPILAGAGSMSTVIVFAHQAHTWFHWASLLVAIILNAVIAYMLLRAAPWLDRLLGRTGVNIVSRLMGLILVAMAIQFVANGMKGLFPGLAQ